MATTKALELAQLSTNLQVDANGNVTNINIDTSQVSEANTALFYTDERVDDRVSNLLVAGDNITLVYDDANNTLTISGVEDDFTNNTTDDLAEGNTNLYYTTTRVQEVLDSNPTIANNLTVTGDLTASANLTVGGDFTVTGNTTFVNSNNLEVEDLNIVIGSNANTTSALNGAGITFGDDLKHFTYTYAGDYFSLDTTLIIDETSVMSNTALYSPAYNPFGIKQPVGDGTTDATLYTTFGRELDGTDTSGTYWRIQANGSGASGGGYITLRDSDSTMNTNGKLPVQIGEGNNASFGIDYYDRVHIGVPLVNGTTSILPTNSLNITTGDPTIGFIDGLGGLGAGVKYSEIDANNGNLLFSADKLGNVSNTVIGFNIDNSRKVTINEDGYVGIGTDSPSYLLHIDNVGGGNGIALQDSNDAGSTGIHFLNNTGTIIAEIEGLSDNTGMAFNTNGEEAMLIDASGNVGIGVLPISTLDVRSENGLGSVLRRDFNGAIANTASKVALTIWGQDHDSADSAQGAIANIGPMIGFGARIDDGNPNTGDIRAAIAYSYNGDLTFHAKSAASVADGSYERLRIDGATGNVGIGTSSPSAPLNVEADQNDVSTGSFTNPHLKLSASGTTNNTGFTGISYANSTLDNFGWTVGSQRTVTSGTVGAFVWRWHNNSTTGEERMRIDSNGNLLVGKTVGNLSVNEGIELRPEGRVWSTVDSNHCIRLNRTNSDGEIINLRKDNSTVGSILAKDGDIVIGTGNTGVRFVASQDAITPATTTDGSGRGSAIDLGNSGSPFKDLYLSGTVHLGSWDITEDGSGNLLFSDGGINKMRLNADGSLDVAGDINANATL